MANDKKKEKKRYTKERKKKTNRGEEEKQCLPHRNKNKSHTTINRCNQIRKDIRHLLRGENKNMYQRFEIVNIILKKIRNQNQSSFTE